MKKIVAKLCSMSCLGTTIKAILLQFVSNTLHSSVFATTCFHDCFSSLESYDLNNLAQEKGKVNTRSSPIALFS